MSEREPVEVTVEIAGQELVAGTLWVHERGGQTASFRYTDSYLTSPDGYALDPVLPKAAGVFHTPPGSAMFSAFADSAPDRWGENLMRREERERARAATTTPRTLSKADFLLGVRDDTHADLRELYRRIIFSVLTANTDDHLRNHAFLREHKGWALSPAYDLNPNPDNPSRLSTAIDIDDNRASIETAISVSGYFRLPLAEACTIISDVERATADWQRIASGLGLPRTQVSRMADAYETDQRRIARSLIA